MEFWYENERFAFNIVRKRVKNINARMKPDGVIHVSAPPHVPEERIVRFLTEHGASFRRMRREQETRRQALPTYEDGSVILHQGQPLHLRYAPRPCPTVLEGDTLTVFARSPEEAKHAVRLWRTAACTALCRKLNREVFTAFCNAGYAVPLARIEIKEMTSRWGSCTAATGRISINFRLMQYPEACMRGVFFHEYTHFLWQDHSPQFYAVLRKLCPDYDRYDALLRDYAFG